MLLTKSKSNESSAERCFMLRPSFAEQVEKARFAVTAEADNLAVENQVAAPEFI